jgi:uncharacterized oxidoreductase
MQLERRTILVTGGARGIGRALSLALIARECEVLVAGRDRAGLEAFAAEHPGKVHIWPCDLSSPADVDALVRAAPEAHPQLSVVINNAGVQNLTDFLTEDVEALAPLLRAEISVNLDAVVRLSTGLLAHLRAQPSAAIVNITSALAIAPKKVAPVYCATKAAVRSFTQALRYQCEDGAPNVKVFDVMMGLVETDMTEGRRQRKITPEQAAKEAIAGVEADKPLIPVAQARLLLGLSRWAPGLVANILRKS